MTGAGPPPCSTCATCADRAGKTTLLNLVMGVLPSVGEMTYGGEPLRGVPLEARMARGSGLVPERRDLENVYARFPASPNAASGHPPGQRAADAGGGGAGP